MDRKSVDSLIDNEREWRIFLIEKIDRIEEKLTNHMAWNLVFRVLGSSVFAITLVWVEYKLNT